MNLEPRATSEYASLGIDLFADYMTSVGITRITSSPYFPQLNGQVENAVKVAKKILSQPDPEAALMRHRAALHTSTVFSTAELLMDRKIQTHLPMLPQQLDPNRPSRSMVAQHDQAKKDGYKRAYDRHWGPRQLSTLKEGDKSESPD